MSEPSSLLTTSVYTKTMGSRRGRGLNPNLESHYISTTRAETVSRTDNPYEQESTADNEAYDFIDEIKS